MKQTETNPPKTTREKILYEALKLFAQFGYSGTSMNDIACRLGITKQALYKHYAGKQDILDSIVKRMNQMDVERIQRYEMPAGDMKHVIAGYKKLALDKIKQYTMAQFLHWTEDEFARCFRRMLTLEQFRNEEMAELYRYYLAEGPLTYITELFAGLSENKAEATLLALHFYGPIFLLYSIYDETDNKQKVTDLLLSHVDSFSRQLTIQ